MNTNDKEQKHGELTIITGPMYSGKSSELIRKANRYSNIGYKILAINHSIDKRYDDSGKICSHDKLTYDDSISIDNLNKLIEVDELINKVEKSDVIIIDEFQFFSETVNMIIYLVEKLKKSVIVSGLDGDHQRKPFGDILKLIPLADNVIRLNSLCCICKDGTRGLFTKKITINNEDVSNGSIEDIIDVGSQDKYITVCRKCYLN